MTRRARQTLGQIRSRLVKRGRTEEDRRSRTTNSGTPGLLDSNISLHRPAMHRADARTKRRVRIEGPPLDSHASTSLGAGALEPVSTVRNGVQTHSDLPGTLDRAPL